MCLISTAVESCEIPIYYVGRVMNTHLIIVIEQFKYSPIIETRPIIILAILQRIVQYIIYYAIVACIIIGAAFILHD